MDVRDLYVRKGDPILPAWKRLLEWARQFRLFAGRGVRLTRTPSGTYIVVDAQAAPWDHPFKVLVSGQETTILPGTVNKLMPTVNGVALDAENAPRLRIAGGPSSELRSWICVQVRVDLKTGAINSDDKDALTIVHVTDLDPATSEGGSPDDGKGIGLHPLAMLIWNGDKASIKRAHQITHFNQQHRFIAAGDGQPSRHLFWPE